MPNPQKVNKGVFIAFEGNDGSGKATQARILSERLKKEGKTFLKVECPAYDSNLFGAFIGECLAGEHGDFLTLDPKIASSLYAFDRVESSAKIREALSEGAVVIADRFTGSNQIHQGGKISDRKERDRFLTWLDKMEHEVLGIPRPDHVLYLRVPIEISLDLIVKKETKKNKNLKVAKDVVEESRAYLENSKATADWLVSREKNWTVIECMEAGSLRSPEAIHEEVWKVAEKAIS